MVNRPMVNRPVNRICHPTSRACSRPAQLHTEPLKSPWWPSWCGYQGSGYQPQLPEKCSKVQQNAARFVQLVSVEVSAKSQQKYAKCQHRNAPPRNKTAKKRNRIQTQQIPGKMGIQAVLCEQDWTRCNQDLTGIQSAVSELVSGKQPLVNTG